MPFDRLVQSTFLGAVFAVVASPILAADPPLVISDFEETVTTGDGTRISVWLGASYFNAPVANGLGTVGDDAGFLFIEQSDNGASIMNPGFSGGASIWTDVGGYSVYGSLDGDFLRATNTDSVISLGSILDTLPITGAPSPGAVSGTIAGDPINSSATIEYGRVTGAAGVGMGGGDGVDWAFGLLGSSAVLHLMSRVSPESFPAAFIDLDETVRMMSAGPMIAAISEHQVGSGATLTLSGRAAALYAHGQLSASQENSNLQTYDAEATAGAFAGLIEAEARLGMEVGNGMELFVSGGVGARNDYFSIVNPRSAPGLEADNPASYDPGPAHLMQDMILRATASVGVSGSF